MNATYHAVKEALHKVNSNLAAVNEALLASPYKPADADVLYNRLIELIPVGTKVTAVYMAKANDFSTLTTFQGVVTGQSSISIHEPSFHVSNETGGILLPGSVLAEA